MLKTVHATYDGKVSRPEEIEIIRPAKAKTGSFLETARSLKLEGPADWSSHLEDYLYGNKSGGMLNEHN